MSKYNRPFKFKQFEVSHHRSSMKVGVDAVILGAWADIANASAILDVGCGSGVISLMCAQRNPNAKITGIDIHEGSIEEAKENYRNSPWRDRLSAYLADFNHYCKDSAEKFDYIISNPPYFDSGIETPESAREIARHQGDLSPEIILEKGSALLTPQGKIGIVIPISQADAIKDFSRGLQMSACRELIMSGREGREPKRAFIEFGLNSDKSIKTEFMTLEKIDGDYTKEYRSLCHDFYLKF